MKLFIGLVLTVLSLNSFADMVEPLPKEDKLAQVGKAIRTLLRDGNISTGTTELSVGRLKVSGKFEAIVRAAFAEEFKLQQDVELPSDAKLKVVVGKFVDGEEKDGHVYKMASAIIESNDYSPGKEVLESQARYVWAVLRKLPISDKTLVGHVKVRLRDNNSQEMRTVQYFLLLNGDKKAVQLYTVEGTM